MNDNGHVVTGALAKSLARKERRAGRREEERRQLEWDAALRMRCLLRFY